MKRRIVMFVVCMIVIISITISVSAATVQNGSTSNTIYYNNKAYTATLFTSYFRPEGTRLGATCGAAIGIKFNDLTVVYDTRSYGFWTETGGARTTSFTAANNTVYSYVVGCSKGMDQVYDCWSVEGHAYFYGDATYRLNVSYEYIT